MQTAPANRLLSSLSAPCRRLFENKLESVSLPVWAPIFDPGKTPRYAYFITSGIASVVTDMENGGAVEVGLLGCESISVGLHLIGGQKGNTRGFMQVGGSGLRMPYDQLASEFSTNDELHYRILQQVQYEALTLCQISGCNRLHELDARLARWLLMVSDRLQSDNLPLTQEFLAEMLGTRRPTVSVSANILQQAGLIEYHRGNVRILDRDGLTAAACECYAIVSRYRHNLYPV